MNVLENSGGVEDHAHGTCQYQASFTSFNQLSTPWGSAMAEKSLTTKSFPPDTQDSRKADVLHVVCTVDTQNPRTEDIRRHQNCQTFYMLLSHIALSALFL
ncbi:hypothetical protein PPTG_23409 [Phytophthora nicotianae INRA-310]|uniref:Uncharacterized protein n=1 Tax=Phytophthora nicotianae (strain INRA-310) TaxID=761204 RepID=W2PYT5_PHYN3|nr:hypothetical protein PPTG_23409 [Phytophthora nicotianae INRA-310]ETN06118.1 hypothetical protein PPTG_23409 [Phytophthora nicotianae INRA-310]